MLAVEPEHQRAASGPQIDQWKQRLILGFHWPVERPTVGRWYGVATSSIAALRFPGGYYAVIASPVTGIRLFRSFDRPIEGVARGRWCAVLLLPASRRSAFAVGTTGESRISERGETHPYPPHTTPGRLTV